MGNGNNTGISVWLSNSTGKSLRGEESSDGDDGGGTHFVL
jgi:hypothetical protein